MYICVTLQSLLIVISSLFRDVCFMTPLLYHYIISETEQGYISGTNMGGNALT